MARRPLLEFEKPLIELEQQIEQIRQLLGIQKLMSASSCFSWKLLLLADVKRFFKL